MDIRQLRSLIISKTAEALYKNEIQLSPICLKFIALFHDLMNKTST